MCISEVEFDPDQQPAWRELQNRTQTLKARSAGIPEASHEACYGLVAVTSAVLWSRRLR